MALHARNKQVSPLGRSTTSTFELRKVKMRAPTSLYDAIIVGAGPGGSAAAACLAAEGCRVLLLEKGVFPRDKVCGDLISPRSIRVLDAIGCGPTVQRAAENQLRGGILHVNGRQIATAYIPEADGLPVYGYAIPRFKFDEIVFRQAQRRGAETLEDCQVEQIRFEPDAVQVDARYGDHARSFRSKLVIGADGVHSIVSRSLGTEHRDKSRTVLALRAYFEDVEGDPSLADMFFDEKFFPGYGWIFQLGGGRANVGLGMIQDVYTRHRMNLRAIFDTWVRENPIARARLGRARLTGRVVGWPLNTFRKSGGNYAERALLVGDAGSFIDPVNGEGIHTALETGVIAAEVASEALKAGDFRSEFLARYEQRWRSALDLDLRVSDMVVTIIRNRELAPLWMSFLHLMGQVCGKDPRYAATCGGMLIGNVPMHHGLSPLLAVQTVLHGPDFWRQTLGLSWDNSLADLLNLGLVTTSRALDAMNGMAQDPAHALSWGANVASTGLGVLVGLGGRYLPGAVDSIVGSTGIEGGMNNVCER
jgi:menaquinone-9 beta-reductase